MGAGETGRNVVMAQSWAPVDKASQECKQVAFCAAPGADQPTKEVPGQQTIMSD